MNAISDIEEDYPETTAHEQLASQFAEVLMSTGKHYFIEENQAGKFAIRAKGSERASRLVDTQRQAETMVKQFNPEDKPDVERVRNTETGGRDQWRKK
jgi:hypothetical protein